MSVLVKDNVSVLVKDRTLVKVFSLTNVNVHLDLNFHALIEGVNYIFVVTHEPIVSLIGQAQKKGVCHDTQKKTQINPVKDALPVNRPPVPPVTNVFSVAEGLVGDKLSKFWEG